MKNNLKRRIKNGKESRNPLNPHFLSENPLNGTTGSKLYVRG